MRIAHLLRCVCIIKRTSRPRLVPPAPSMAVPQVECPPFGNTRPGSPLRQPSMQSAWTGSLKPRSELFLISRTRLLQSAEFRSAGRVDGSRALRAPLHQVGFFDPWRARRGGCAGRPQRTSLTWPKFPDLVETLRIAVEAGRTRCR